MVAQIVLQTLSNLGLTILQAKVYFTLFTIGTCSAKAVSEKSGVFRPDVYRIMPALEKMGLVEKTVASPAKYKAIPLNEAISILLKKRKAEVSELQVESRLLLSKMGKNHETGSVESDNDQFIMIPKGEPNIKKRIQSIHHSRHVCCITSLKRLNSIPYRLHEEIQEFLKKRGTVRVIIDRLKCGQSLPAKISPFMKMGNYQIRCTCDPTYLMVSLFDKNEAIIDLSPTTNLADSPSLWTNNSGIVQTLQDYFEGLWITSTVALAPHIVNKTDKYDVSSILQ